MSTSDVDFIDLDISSVQSNKVIIAVHGLEGSSNSSYIKSLTQFANSEKYDVIVMNLRGCSGEPNLLLSSYHSGKTSDLLEVIQFVEKKELYNEIHIVGYSLGGNLTLKLMGELGENDLPIVKTSIGVSVPCDLKGSSEVLNKGFNKLYQHGILQSLLKKAKQKIERFPNSGIDKTKILKAKNFNTYDEYFTAVINDFQSADDYYRKSSCKQYIKDIKIPSLILSALDDSFLSDSCYPYEEVKNNKHVQLLTPKYGGHVGFYTSFKKEKNYWLENQILEFIKTQNIVVSNV
jgi:predicted alpha/beta-fold hydrolase